jgi:hypothetical protein
VAAAVIAMVMAAVSKTTNHTNITTTAACAMSRNGIPRGSITTTTSSNSTQLRSCSSSDRVWSCF